MKAYSEDLRRKIVDAIGRGGMPKAEAARTKEALLEVLGEAFSAVSAQDARGYVEHAG
jgi:transposase